MKLTIESMTNKLNRAQTNLKKSEVNYDSCINDDIKKWYLADYHNAVGRVSAYQEILNILIEDRED